METQIRRARSLESLSTLNNSERPTALTAEQLLAAGVPSASQPRDFEAVFPAPASQSRPSAVNRFTPGPAAPAQTSRSAEASSARLPTYEESVAVSHFAESSEKEKAPDETEDDASVPLLSATDADLERAGDIEHAPMEGNFLGIHPGISKPLVAGIAATAATTVLQAGTFYLVEGAFRLLDTVAGGSEGKRCQAVPTYFVYNAIGAAGGVVGIFCRPRMDRDAQTIASASRWAAGLSFAATSAIEFGLSLAWASTEGTRFHPSAHDLLVQGCTANAVASNTILAPFTTAAIVGSAALAVVGPPAAVIGLGYGAYTGARHLSRFFSRDA